MSQTTKVLNQLTKIFFRNIFLSQDYLETDFYLEGEIYNPDNRYFCFKEDLETGITICFVNAYLETCYSGCEWHVEKFCLCNEYVLMEECSKIFMKNIVQTEYNTLESYAIKIPANYVIRTQLENPKKIYSEIMELSSSLLYSDGFELEDLIYIPWLKEIQDLINCVFAPYGISQFFYIAHAHNVREIIKNSIKSRNELKKHQNIGFGVEGLEDISNQNVQKIRAEKSIGNFQLHNFVNLYLNPYNPMMFSLKEQHEKLVILGISPLVSLCKNTCISDGNAAANNTNFFDFFDGLDKLDWSTIYSKSWHNKLDGKRIRCAEVLVPERIPVNYLENIYFKSNRYKDNFLNYFKEFFSSETDKYRMFIFPNLSSQPVQQLKYINVKVGNGVEEFIEALNSISVVKPSLFG